MLITNQNYTILFTKESGKEPVEETVLIAASKESTNLAIMRAGKKLMAHYDGDGIAQMGNDGWRNVYQYSF